MDVTFDFAGSDENNPVATVTAIDIHANEVDLNDAQTPEGIAAGELADPIVYILRIDPRDDPTIGDPLQSQEFSGDFDWYGVIMPAAGVWTAGLFDVRDTTPGSAVASTDITVDAP